MSRLFLKDIRVFPPSPRPTPQPSFPFYPTQSFVRKERLGKREEEKGQYCRYFLNVEIFQTENVDCFQTDYVLMVEKKKSS